MTDQPTSALPLDDPASPLDAVAPSGLAWKRIAEDLAADIRGGHFKPGDILPPSTTLAEQFGVHRHTVRQAFKHLAENGLVSVERGRGTQVLAQRFPYRIGKRVSLRTNFGAAGIAVTSAIISGTVTDASQAVAEALGIPVGHPIHTIRTVNRAGVVPVSSGVHYLDHDRFPAFMSQLEEAGASISQALKLAGIPDYIRLSTRLSARLATAEEATLLDLPEGAPVMQSIGIDALPDQTPFHLVEGVFAGERMDMIIEPFGDS